MRLMVALSLIGLLILPFARQDSLAAGPVASEEFMASTANPLATKAARDIIVAGGSAVDAAIAAQMVLGLVEPQSSGIGGGAFLLFYDADDRTVTSFDGRETAPFAATPSLFLKPDGEPMSWLTASEGGLPVGTPGVVKMLEMVHARHGNLPWADLFEPAIGLAENGFTMSPRLYELLAWVDAPERFPTFFNHYFDHNGERKPVGTNLVNPDYAQTLRQIAEDGAEAFYNGPIAESIIAAVEGASVNPGLLALDDLRAYQAKERPPVCASYRIWQICGMGPPSSGGLTVLQILLLLENQDAQTGGRSLA